VERPGRGFAVAANFFFSTSRSRSGSARTKMAPGIAVRDLAAKQVLEAAELVFASWSIVNCTR
jgi:hypothetical protein